MNLALDIGNSSAKASVFEAGRLVAAFRGDRVDAEAIFAAYPDIEQAIVSTVGDADEELERELRRRVRRLVRFDAATPVPLRNLYLTPATLGMDRLAAAVGAAAMFPGRNVLVVDFGTAITMDVVTAEGEFAGGNISPGMDMRFRALHERTARLPLCAPPEQTTPLGLSTEEAVCNGVVCGIIYEIEGCIARLGERYDGLEIIFTGGDAKYFAERLKNTIFATCDLVAYGLNRILEYGDQD